MQAFLRDLREPIAKHNVPKVDLFHSVRCIEFHGKQGR